MTSAAQGRRPQAAGIAADTPIQKVLHPTIADLYRGNVVVPGRFEPHRIAGFCTRLQDVAATAQEYRRVEDGHRGCFCGGG